MLLLDSVLTQVLLNTDMLHHAKNISTGVKVKGNTGTTIMVPISSLHSLNIQNKQL